MAFYDLINPIIKYFHQLNDLYHWVQSFGDERVKNWFLMSSPFPTLILVIFYLMIVKYLPILVKNRKPFKLKYLMIYYNVFNILLNLWIGLELLYCGLKRNYNFICQLVDRSMNEYEMRIAKAIWWYYFSKLIEFMDTIFFILRKKIKQLTFLHIYHHSTMFAFWWVGAKFVPGGSALTGAMVNCFVHVLMYSYYGLSAMSSSVRKHLWWKKYLTILQLLQFTAGVILGLDAILTNCQFTKWMQYFFVCYAFSFLLLFVNFYNLTYNFGDKIIKKN